MEKIFSVAFATGSRADYGIVRKYLRLLDQDPQISLRVLVTGALLSRKYAHQVELIYRDGFQIDAEIDIEMDSSSNAAVSHSMAVALDRFSHFFSTHQYDLLIILGDRFEMFSVATAAAMERIPILHIHGGEATFGNYDEFIRHCITKMATYHFASTEEYRKRVIQLGEMPERTYYLGSLGAENCLNILDEEVPASIKALKPKSYFVVLFHPETLTNVSTLDQINELLVAIAEHDAYDYVFLGSNADTHSEVIRTRIRNFINVHKNTAYYENLPTSGFHYLLKKSLGLIGNSSSGLIEAPSLGVFTINIGDRQAGRVRGNSVIDIRCTREAIGSAINQLATNRDLKEIFNPYYKENTAENYYTATKKILSCVEKDTAFPKRFHDVADRTVYNK